MIKILNVFFQIQSFPLVLVLMSNRTTASYEKVFNYINTEILNLDGATIMTDFERAMRNALRKIAPNSVLLACWFHFCQALRRKIASIPELFFLIRSNTEARIFYRQFQCLALLPADKIEAAFVQLAYNALKKFKQFERFVKYFDKQWIKSETPEGFSVFNKVNSYFFRPFRKK